MADKNNKQDEALELAQEALFREVEEDLRQEQLKKLWEKYGLLLIGTAIAIVLTVAGYQGYSAYRTSVEIADSTQYQKGLDALENGNATAADTAFAALLENAGTDYDALSTFRLAAIAVKNGDTDKAVSLLRTLENDNDLLPPLRDVATLKRFYLMLDSLKLDDVSERLDRLAHPESPWRSSALELKGFLYLKEGDIKGAHTIFTSIAEDDRLAPGIRTRATETLATLPDVPKDEAPQDDVSVIEDAPKSDS